MPVRLNSQISVVARKKVGGLGEHFGVELPDGSILHCTPERGTYRSSAEEFASGKDVRTVRSVPYELHREVLRREQWINMNPQPYHVAKMNCEVFANWLTCAKPESDQVNGLVVLAFVAAAIRLAA